MRTAAGRADADAAVCAETAPAPLRAAAASAAFFLCISKNFHLFHSFYCLSVKTSLYFIVFMDCLIKV